MMKILHSISSLYFSSGGPSLSTWSLVNGLVNIGVHAEIVTFRSKNPADKMIGDNSLINLLPPFKISRFAYSTEIVPFLNANPFDVYHGNGLWEYPNHAISVFARKSNKPYIISPRGMLYPEALRNSPFLKKIALTIYQRKDLKNASVIHATCYQELEYIRALGFQNPVAVIPNSIDISMPKLSRPSQKRKRQIGFLGRFAPIKNIEVLLRAWAAVGSYKTDWELVLIGDGDPAYKNHLIQLVQLLEIRNIRFTGFLTGSEKENALRSLDYLVLPSKSENFGMVVPEALLREIPVIASKETPWEELNTLQAGWWINIDIDGLAQTLENAMGLSEETRQMMGIKGRNLIEKKYSIQAVTSQMFQLYYWVLNEGKKPDFLFD